MSSDFSQFAGWTPDQPVPGSGQHAPAYAPVQYGPQDTPPAPPQAPPGPDPMAVLHAALDRIGQLERQLAQQSAGVGADVPKLTGPTHDLYLADGTHVEGTGAIPTQVHLEDGRILPVAWAVAR